MRGSPGDNPEVRKGRFNSDRDELLYLMAISGWADQSCGDTQASTGWFARISNPPGYMEEVERTFTDEARKLGYPDFEQVQGHFLLIEDGQGFIHVTAYETEPDLIADFRVRQEVYEQEAGA